MKTAGVASIVLSVMILGACAANERETANNDAVYKESGNTVNRDDRHDLYNRSNNNNKYGFVREVKSPVPGETADIGRGDTLDREKTASMISKMTVALPNVLDSSVVVTDAEVLISYKLSETDNKTRFETADQVKKTAMSVVPRWYHVYVTDDPALRQYVENIGSINPYTANKNKAITDTIRMMKESSPQGRKVSDTENENGETKEDRMINSR
ncbi:YhcN/YlaJ family sporulation lipoprotein [Siminovitchia fortis]|uniref:Sporulation protein n=1 Tax=Siminovitchia fortis TaxID=254758 RepID=A0A443IMH4_9BACI|nr:YhcN/YlaJ family sporulation lipoprotein [Siminovitchia fortis]RWR06970.1 sporulation protein [Siminovitchia fortis]WHY82131.1 YhcN/YlaJ family sporulation lipoprotein [Siminovitchia fortis]